MSGVIFGVIGTVFSLSEVQRRQINDLMEWANRRNCIPMQSNPAVFNASLDPILGTLIKSSFFAKLFAMNLDDLPMESSDLTERYADEDTLNFITALGEVESGERQTIFLEHARQLERQLRPVNSYYWTGLNQRFGPKEH
jgi:hypothetical protein